jgi:preprotein translocase subunit SecF
MKQHFSIIAKAYLWLLVGAIIMTGSLWLFFTNMRLSIQFTGGMEVVVDQDINGDVFVPAMEQALSTIGYTDVVVGVGEKDGYDSVLLQIEVADDNQVSAVTDLVQDTLLTTKTIASIDNILESSIT